MSDIEIRPAVEGDCETVLSMLANLAEETGDGERFRCRSEDLLEFGFGKRSLFHCLIASRRGQSLGMALYFPIFSTTRGRPGVYLQDLWVSSACRDEGLGTVLLQRVVDDAGRSWQAAYLDLMVHGHNDGAERFYRRHGFEERTDDRHLTIDGDAFQALRRTTRA
jgi:ribosomal protein S18 acetylase RimI-like enzyme